MSPLTNWELFHRYRHLVEEGKASPILCPDCNNPLVTRLGTNDEPALWCATCNSTLTPGLDLYQRIRAVVTEHYL